MNNTLKIIFDNLITTKYDQFNTDEMDKKETEFLNANFSNKDVDEYENIFTEFYEIILENQEKAFEMGFNTAVDLLTRTNADERKIKNEFVKQKNR